MGAITEWLTQRASAMLALAVILAFYRFAQLPTLSAFERKEMASRFRFTKIALPEASNTNFKGIQQINPSMREISPWIASLGAAAALADLDGDGLPNDVCLVDPRTGLVTVSPVPTTRARYQPFVLDPSPLPYDPSTMAPMGCLPGDFNEDGLMDILVYYWGRTPVLFLRKANDLSQGHTPVLKREDYVARELVPGGGRWYTSAATLADLDGDGHLDLLLANYFPDGAQILGATGSGREETHASAGTTLSGGHKHFFLWKNATVGVEPAVSFQEVVGVLPPQIDQSWTLAVGAADLDGDLLPEIYLANDLGPDRLLHNCSHPGKLCFSLLEGQAGYAALSSVVGHDSFKGMGVDFGDLNGDGLLGIYVSNVAAEWGLQRSHFLRLSTEKTQLIKAGVTPYEQASESLGLSRSGWAWDSRLSDFDNDGTLEAIQATGSVASRTNRGPELQATGPENSQFLHNTQLWSGFLPGDDASGNDHLAFLVRSKSGRYYDIGPDVGLGNSMVSRAISIADVDGDGRLDFVVANQQEESYFFHNDTPLPNDFLGLHLLLPLHAGDPEQTRERAGHPGADTPGRPAIGASVTVHLPDGRKLTAQVDGGSGHSGKRSPDLHFGLGRLSTGEKVPAELHWRDPDGAVHWEHISLLPGWHTIELGWPPRTAQVRQP
jgi:enediyne biosynthesis protein E4